MVSKFQTSPQATSASPQGKFDEAGFLDALGIADRISRAYDLLPESCPAEWKLRDCRIYQGTVQVCALKCWQRPVLLKLWMEADNSVLHVELDKGSGNFRSAIAQDLEDALVQEFAKVFPPLRRGGIQKP